MRDAVKGYLTLAAGLTEVTRQRATAAAKALVAAGEARTEQVSQLVDDLLAQSKQNREAVSALVTYEVDRAFGRLRLATNDEVASLVERVRSLEAELRGLRNRAGGSQSASAAPAKPSAATTSAEQKSVAQKAPAKKSAAKKSTAKSSAAKSSATKSSAAKKSAAKSSAKKAPAKTSAAKKTSATTSTSTGAGTA